MSKLKLKSVGGDKLALAYPTGEQINLVDEYILKNPYPIYEQLRAESPIFYTESIFNGAWVFLDYDDVDAFNRDTERISNDKSRGLVRALTPDQAEEFKPLVEAHARWMVTFDPPRHTRIRKLMAAGFSPAIIEKLKPYIQQIVAELIAEHAHKPKIDIIGDFAWKIPILVIARFLGVRDADLDQFIRWTDATAQYLGSEKPNLETMPGDQTHFIELESYFLDVIAERRKKPIPGDILSLLIGAEIDGEKLGNLELAAQCAFLVHAGTVTTRGLIGNSIYAILRHPDQHLMIKRDLKLILPAIEEVLRFECPVQFVGRVINEDFSYKGFPMKKGDFCVLMVGAANRDPKHFSRPDVMDIMRTDCNHISFGSGVHSCLGQRLNRLEGQIAVRAFIEKFPNATIESHEWEANAGLRGLKHLLVDVT